ncbi:MAG: hypothetical protein QM763_08495 [Agriterribacter sp.]
MLENMRGYDIAIILCWYGPYPWYFPYFIHSCTFNPTIDFYIITDNRCIIDNKPSNVWLIYMTINEIKVVAQQRLGFNVNIDYPYKFCDFKPAYGFLFPEIIGGYDYWGYSDLDIIYGNIRSFLDNEMLAKYDFISVRHDYTTGCFALYRNNEKMNTFFMRSKDYRLVLSNPEHFCFDECNFRWNELAEGKSILELHTDVESLTHIIKAAELKNEITAHFDFIVVEGKTGQIVFDHGRIIYKNQFEAILFHLIWLKRTYFPGKTPKKIPDKYYISPTRIYHHRTSKKISA